MQYPGFGTEWKFNAIKAAMDKEDWAPADQVLDGADKHDEARTVLLGSWMHNSPSGKIYAPWSSNITEGEAEQDEIWREYLVAGLEEVGLFLEEYDGDLFAAEMRPAGVEA